MGHKRMKCHASELMFLRKMNKLATVTSNWKALQEDVAFVMVLDL